MVGVLKHFLFLFSIEFFKPQIICDVALFSGLMPSQPLLTPWDIQPYIVVNL